MDDLNQKKNLSFGHISLIFVILLVLTGSLVNLDGGDWDGVQIVLGSVFFNEAVQGQIIRYNFAWQPLTYGIIRLTHFLFPHCPDLLFYLPAIFGSLGMTIYIAAMRKVGQNRLGILFLLGLLLLMPEFIFDSIYMNSTIFGFPFAALAIWLILDIDESSENSNKSYSNLFLSGLCIAAASLCRFDFLLTCPMFLFLMFRNNRKQFIQKIALISLGGLFAFGIAYLAGYLDPIGLVKTGLGHEAGMGEQGAFYRSLGDRVLMTILGINFFMWVFAGVAALYSCIYILKKKQWLSMLIVIPILVLLYPVKSLATPKYLLGFYMFLGLFVSWFFSRIKEAKQNFICYFRPILALCVLLACFLPIRPGHKHGLAVEFTTNTWKKTDDGVRSFWGYCYSLKKLSSKTKCPEWLIQNINNPQNILIKGPFDGWVSGTQSQPYVLTLLKYYDSVEVNSKFIAGCVDSKKILLTDPDNFEENHEKQFTSLGLKPVLKNIETPLRDIEKQALEIISEGVSSKDDLRERMILDEDQASELLRELQRRGLIEWTENGFQSLHNFTESN